MISRFVDWFIRSYIEKEQGEVQHDIAYVGGKGLGVKKIKLELQSDVNVHFLI